MTVSKDGAVEAESGCDGRSGRGSGGVRSVECGKWGDGDWSLAGVEAMAGRTRRCVGEERVWRW